jgi:hypothetical protein
LETISEVFLFNIFFWKSTQTIAAMERKRKKTWWRVGIVLVLECLKFFASGVAMISQIPLLFGVIIPMVGAQNIATRALSDFTTPTIQYLNPSEAFPHHWFGAALHVSDDVAIVGATGDSDYSKYGNAYVLQVQGGKWVEVGKLTANNPGIDDGFGSAVSIYLGYAFVGASRYVQFF